MAVHQDRIERLERLLRALPTHKNPDDCPDPGALLQRLGELYEDSASDAAKRRAIQRDLGELVRTERAEILSPSTKPQRYRRRTDIDGPDPLMLDYAFKSMRTLVKDTLPTRRFEDIWQHLLGDNSAFGLNDSTLRIVTDTQRLLPAEVSDTVLAAILEALTLTRTLNVRYIDADDKRTEPVLHPQALMQRGPRVYLYALKNDEVAPVRMYALHRFLHAEVGNTSARQDPTFDLQKTILLGQADFGGGEHIQLVFRARGYVAELLRDCPLTESQRTEDEEDGSDFDAQITATVPATGQLLRWLLGFGDKVEVLEPPELRRVVTAQVGKAAALYA